MWEGAIDTTSPNFVVRGIHQTSVSIVKKMFTKLVLQQIRYIPILKTIQMFNCHFHYIT